MDLAKATQRRRKRPGAVAKDKLRRSRESQSLQASSLPLLDRAWARSIDERCVTLRCLETHLLMKIVDAKVIVCCPGRNFVTLKLVTEDGIHGLGDATLNGRELAVASYLSDHVVPLLIGRDARRIEDTWHYLYKGAYWRRGPVTMSAIAAVDTALWDIRAKCLGVPLYQLLGGAAREAVMVYGHASGTDVDDTVQAAAQFVERGYKAVRAQAGIPGLPTTY